MITNIFLSLVLICAFLIPLYIFFTKRGKKHSILFYAGLVYILIGITFIPSLMLYFGIISCVIGFFFLGLRNQKLPKIIQGIISLLPISILIGFIFYTEPSKNIFLIPKNYLGRIVIIHGCKNGTEKEFDGLYRIYKIPQSGILKTKFAFAGNSFDSLHSKYFYIDAHENREEILVETTKIHPHGLWTLSYNRKGDTIIDFILDLYQENPYLYQSEKNDFYQREIDSCLK